MTNATEPGKAGDDIFATRVRMTREQAAEIIQSGEYDYGDRPHIAEQADGTVLLDLFVSDREIAGMRERGLDVEVLSNQSERARERLAEVGQGDRFEGGKTPPRGIGRKIGRRGSRGDESAS